MLGPDARSGAEARPWNWMTPIIFVVFIIALVGILLSIAASAGSGQYGWGWMMGGEWDSMWVVGTLMMVIPVLLLVLLIGLLFRPTPPPPVLVSSAPAADPASTVRMRYARGEITTEQYRQISSELQRSS